MRAAIDTGRLVPDDLSDVGFDGTRATGGGGVTLTTIRQSHEDKGRVAARLLLAAWCGDTPKSVTLPHDLIVESSAGQLS